MKKIKYSLIISFGITVFMTIINLIYIKQKSDPLFGISIEGMVSKWYGVGVYQETYYSDVWPSVFQKNAHFSLLLFFVYFLIFALLLFAILLLISKMNGGEESSENVPVDIESYKITTKDIAGFMIAILPTMIFAGVTLLITVVLYFQFVENPFSKSPFIDSLISIIFTSQFYLLPSIVYRFAVIKTVISHRRALIFLLTASSIITIVATLTDAIYLVLWPFALALSIASFVLMVAKKGSKFL